jgi:hypothetical protein
VVSGSGDEMFKVKTACIWVTGTLLTDVWLMLGFAERLGGYAAHLKEQTEFQIVLDLILQPLLSYWQMSNVQRVRPSKLGGSSQEHIT